MIVLSKKLDKLMKDLRKNSSETFYHMLRTKKYVNDFLYFLNTAGYTSYDDFEIDCICKGAMLHDIGKLSVDNYILTKDTRLDNDEMAEMEGHSEASFDLVKDELDEDEYEVVTNICRYHHERIDGSGYNGISEFPFYVAIVSICDVYDALSYDRIYRDGLPRKKVLDMISRGECGEFDVELVLYFTQFINTVEE